ncbi:MAG: hypothetical protein IJZ63_04140 [Clostridia bacterium]|nr:hypothetical protein [Clostridia bacterium]
MYGFLNLFLMQWDMIKLPVQWFTAHPMIISCIVLFFTLLAPVFGITFIISKLKKPVFGASLSLCSIPVFTFTQAHLLMQLFGYPSSLCFLPHYFSDYLRTRFEVGYAYAMLVLCIIAFAIFCALLCLAVFGISKLVSFIKINAKTKTVLGYVFFGAGLSNVLPTVALSAMVLIEAVKPYNELFIFPPRLLPRSPTLHSFTQFFDLLENVWFSPVKLIASIIIYSLILFLVYAFTLLPSSIGVSILKTKYKPLLLLSLCSLIVLSPQYHTSYEIFTIRVDYFLSGLFFLSLLFVGYFAVKSMLYNSKTRIIRIIIGTLTIITSAFSSAAVSIMWCPYNDYNLSNYSMYTFLTTMSQSVARMGEGLAGSVLLLFSTVAIAFLPSLLIITLYVIRKIEKR